jgi:hypothetical protein
MLELTLGEILWIVAWAIPIGAGLVLWNLDDKVKNDQSPEAERIRLGYGSRS